MDMYILKMYVLFFCCESLLHVTVLESSILDSWYELFDVNCLMSKYCRRPVLASNSSYQDKCLLKISGVIVDIKALA